MPPAETSFTFDHVILSPSEQIGLHKQETFELALVIKGSGVRTIGSVTGKFREGDLVLIPPGMPHCWRFSDGGGGASGDIENTALAFSPALLSALAGLLPEARPLLSRLLSLRDGLVFEGRKRRDLRRLMERMRHAHTAARLPIFLRILSLLSGSRDEERLGALMPRSRREERREALRVYLACNYMRDITLGDAATHVGMNRSSFCTYFRRETGSTFVDYLNAMRIAQAKKILREEGATPVSEICFRCGFNSVSHFNHVFRRAESCNPTEYHCRAAEK